MSRFPGLAVRAFLQGRHDAARTLLAARAPSVGKIPTAAGPDRFYVQLVEILRRALQDDGNEASSRFDAAVEELGELHAGMPDMRGSMRGRFVMQQVRRVGRELARLAGRTDMVDRFGPRATLGEAIWRVAASSEVLLDEGSAAREEPSSDEDVDVADASRDSGTPTPEAGGSDDADRGERHASTVPAFGPIWQTPGFPMPTVAVPPARYAFSEGGTRAQVRVSSRHGYRSFPGTLQRAGRLTGPRTKLRVRLADEATIAGERLADGLPLSRATVRFELDEADGSGPVSLAFREAGLTPTDDGFTLGLDLEHASFATDQRADEIWSAILSADDLALFVIAPAAVQ